MIRKIFLILIGPISCITYPIDKISDGKAQAFNKWFSEFMSEVLIQPFHLLLYVVLMIKDVHNYKLGGLILNIILTAVAMIVMVLIYLMVYILSMQLIEFFINLIEEAVYMYG